MAADPTWFQLALLDRDVNASFVIINDSLLMRLSSWGKGDSGNRPMPKPTM
jgi:hypothetical protein